MHRNVSRETGPVLVEPLTKSLSSGHRRAAIRRFLLLVACDYDVPDRYKPYDPGWVLVGDAAYHKDPITAQGDAMADWQLERDEGALSMYDFTCQLATLEPPPPEMQQLFAALAGRPLAMDAFVRMNAGTISPAEFFAPAHVAAMLGTPVETAFA